ncbi:ABC transporter permease [Aminithiophilus ramosus]|uniref:ABC transporter permease n=1 Tax=Aminithiophilus ramosus TaxID=3029084 RepID=A0A9Q7EW25_9BACT|nr:ABC transporter permease [Aminithiophilus ramosus]QTX32454.1 ABC transporter permease [Aminithiophilus ramosus]
MIAAREILRIALRSLRVNRMRSALTMLGIVIGVAAVIAMFAIGNGANEKIGSTIASMGTNLLMVLPGSATSGGARQGSSSVPTLTLEDAEAIGQEITTVEDVAPVLNGSAQIVFGNANWATTVWGTTTSIMNVRSWTLASGRVFNDSDVRSAAKVCILGQTVAEELFGRDDPLGKTVRINKIPMTVIGLLTEKGSAAMGNDQDDVLFVPVTTAQKRLFGSRFPGKIGTIMVKAVSSETLDFTQEEVTRLLAQRHRIRSGQENDFDVRNLSEFLETAKESTRIMSLLLASVASVSLLVGGIGIMNIMLVSVTERTREIGIRRAIGAKQADILAQFLAEALLLSLAGGLVGIALGGLGSTLLSRFAGWTTAVSSLSVGLAFGFSALIGVFFGFYPAWKASELRPIDALKYE